VHSTPLFKMVCFAVLFKVAFYWLKLILFTLIYLLVVLPFLGPSRGFCLLPSLSGVPAVVAGSLPVLLFLPPQPLRLLRCRLHHIRVVHGGNFIPTVLSVSNVVTGGSFSPTLPTGLCDRVPIVLDGQHCQIPHDSTVQCELPAVFSASRQHGLCMTGS
jgi:hypothetical protein